MAVAAAEGGSGARPDGTLVSAPQMKGDALRAVEHRGSHLQIIASAGSGKTESSPSESRTCSRATKTRARSWKPSPPQNNRSSPRANAYAIASSLRTRDPRLQHVHRRRG